MARIRLSTSSSPRPGRIASPKVDDSPSRQLLLDLERALCQFQIHEVELKEVHAYDCRSFQENLDLLDAKKAEEDLVALEAATCRHENVRIEAEAELHQYYREAEERQRLERQRQEERQRLEKQRQEEQRAKEQQAHEEAEARRRANDEAKKKARIEKEAAAKKAAEKEADRRKQETLAREQAERVRKQKEEQEKAERQEADEKAAREKAQRAENTQHRRYLEIHQHLKRFRKDFWSQCRKNANLKSKVGDMRRGIKTSVGQLTEIKGANRQPTERIKTILKDAITISTPPVDLRNYFATPPAACQTAEQSQCPSLLVYMLSIFSKAVISQFGSESGISIKAAEPAGVLVAHIFATTEFQIQGNSLIDILLAKLHSTCPVLWGVYGDEKTAAGRQLLGWRKEDGQFVSESRHYERVSGFGAGFASIALRNFSKSRLQNPLPPPHFWESLANIVNVPPAKVQPTHLFVLKAMLENSVERFIQFYGSAAIAALCHSLIKFPASLPQKLQDTASCKSIVLLADMLAREKNLRL